jgi:hypothetical protein
MINRFLVTAVVAALSTTSATVHVEVTLDNRGLWRVPIRPLTRSAEDVISARAILDLGGVHGFEYFSPDLRDSRSAAIADGYYIGGNDSSTTIYVHTDDPFAIPMESSAAFWTASHASIGTGFNSPFARTVHHYIISPTNSESGLLVLNPENPDQYAFLGEWFYVNSSNNVLPQITASVVVGDSIASDPPDLFTLVSKTDISWIPQEAFRNIVRHLERAGFRVSGAQAGIPNPVGPIDMDSIGRGRTVLVTGNLAVLGHEMIAVPELSAEELAQVLPPIYFDIGSIERFRITLLPQDYIRTVDDLAYILIGARRRGRCSIGTNVLQRLALHIDLRNRRIGFADPVNEI